MLKFTNVALSVVLAALLLAACGTNPIVGVPFEVSGTVLAADTGAPVATDVVALDDDGELIARTSVAADGTYALRGRASAPGTIELVALASDGFAADAADATVPSDVVLGVPLRPVPLPEATALTVPSGAFVRDISTPSGIEVQLSRTDGASDGATTDLEVRAAFAPTTTRDPAREPVASVLVDVRPVTASGALATAAADLRFAEGVTVDVRVPVLAGEIQSFELAFFRAATGAPVLAERWLAEAGATLLWRSDLRPVRETDEVDPDDEWFVAFSYPLTDYLEANGAFRDYLPFSLVWPPTETACFVGAVQGPDGRVRSEGVSVTVASTRSDYTYELTGLRTTPLGLLTVDLTMPGARDGGNMRADLGTLEIATDGGLFSVQPTVPVLPTFDGGCGSLGVIEVDGGPGVPVRTFDVLVERDGAPAGAIPVTVQDEGLDAQRRAAACEAGGGCNEVRAFTGPDGRVRIRAAIREGASPIVTATLPPSEGGQGTRVVADAAADRITVQLPPRKESSVEVTFSPGDEIVAADGLTVGFDVRTYDGRSVTDVSNLVQSLYVQLVRVDDPSFDGPFVVYRYDPRGYQGRFYDVYASAGSFDYGSSYRWVFGANDLAAIPPGAYRIEVAARTFWDDFSGTAERDLTLEAGLGGAGRIDVTINGLPEGASADATLTLSAALNPDDYDLTYERTFTESGSARGLVGGAYQLAALDVVFGGVTYTPDAPLYEAFLSDSSSSSSIEVNYRSVP